MHEKKSIKGIGIDVSKEHLDITMSSETDEHFIVKNSLCGIKKLIEKMKNYKGKIVMESTGRYHLLVALKLSLAQFDVRVINPLMARKYLTASIRNNKTDKADSKILAEMAIVERNLPDAFHQNKMDIQIRQKMGFLASLEKQMQNFQSFINDYNYFHKELSLQLSPTEENIMRTIKELLKQKHKLEEEIQQLILEQNQDDNKQNLLISVPGISPLVASLMVQFLSTDVPSYKNWIAFVGLDVSARQSGNWIGKGKLSKRGNPYLRKRFFSAAWGAIMHNTSFKQYYNNLKNRGLKHVEALLVIARKILNIAFVLLKNKQFFNEKICFPTLVSQ